MDGLEGSYGLADPVFYDAPSRVAARFPVADRELPAGWRTRQDATWLKYQPEGRVLPEQGWKIHVAATPGNVDEILETVWDHCVEARVPFKILSNRHLFMAANSKMAARGSSGKLVAIYPGDEPELRQLLDDLGAKLAGQPGPYILSDLRIGAGPLHVRYGGFVERHTVSPTGELVHAITRPDGVLVPDERKPYFVVPEWVDVPGFFAPHLAARDAKPGYFPYRVEEALHFSNGGGVYLARRQDDDIQVVLKEARPHAGLDGIGRDAVQRLENERQALTALAGAPGIPALLDHFTVWEHAFLAVEHLPGDTLQRWMAEHYPLLRDDPSRDVVDDFTARALTILDRLAALLTGMHDRGWAFGDLHPGNVMVGAGGEVGLVDFELSAPVGEVWTTHVMGVPGFSGPSGLTCAQRDLYALDALRLWMFLPLVALHHLEGDLRRRHIDAAVERFRLPAELVAGLRALPVDAGALAGTFTLKTEEHTPVPAYVASVADGILAAATPDRADRLFPGDPLQFELGGANFAYGAAGVLWALDVTGQDRRPELTEWLAGTALAEERPRPGFYGGLGGAAYMLLRLGRREQAVTLLDRLAGESARIRDVGLYDGLPGIGLNLLHFARATGDERFRRQAADVAGTLAGIVADGRGVKIGLLSDRPGRTPGEGGLMRGWSGAALFFIRLYEDGGDPAHLELAARAIERDLALCDDGPGGSLVVNGGFRSLSYLAVGGAGIALVANEVLRHADHPAMAAAVPRLLQPCGAEFVATAQLFSGRAGLLATYARLDLHTDPETRDRVVRRHLSRFAWHAMPYRGHHAFPGQGPVPRLSTDLATGAAGVLLGVAATTEPHREFLPFLDPWLRPDPERAAARRTATTNEERR